VTWSLWTRTAVASASLAVALLGAALWIGEAETPKAQSGEYITLCSPLYPGSGCTNNVVTGTGALSVATRLRAFVVGELNRLLDQHPGLDPANQ
jgi:hypothetical protein